MILLVFAGSVKVWPLAWTVSVRRRGRTARWTRRSRAPGVEPPDVDAADPHTGSDPVGARWSYAYAAAAAMPARTTRNQSTMKGARLRERRRCVARLLAGGRPSWTVAFTCIGCHTKRPWADKGIAPRTVCTASVREAQTYDHQDRPGAAHRAARRTEIPQLGFGVFQVPPEDTAEAVDPRASRPATATSTPRPPTATRPRSARRSAPPGLAREEVFVTTKCWNDRPGLRRGDARVRAEPRPARARLRRPLPDPLAGPGAGPLRRDLAGVHRAAAARAASRSIGVSNFQPDAPRAGSSTRRA